MVVVCVPGLNGVSVERVETWVHRAVLVAALPRTQEYLTSWPYSRMRLTVNCQATQVATLCLLRFIYTGVVECSAASGSVTSQTNRGFVEASQTNRGFVEAQTNQADLLYRMIVVADHLGGSEAKQALLRLLQALQTGNAGPGTAPEPAGPLPPHSTSHRPQAQPVSVDPGEASATDSEATEDEDEDCAVDYQKPRYVPVRPQRWGKRRLRPRRTVAYAY